LFQILFDYIIFGLNENFATGINSNILLLGTFARFVNVEVNKVLMKLNKANFV